MKSWKQTKSQKLGKDGEATEVETRWTYKFVTPETKESVTIVTDDPLPFEVGDGVTPEQIAAAQSGMLVRA